jgi:hypothetical protein
MVFVLTMEGRGYFLPSATGPAWAADWKIVSAQSHQGQEVLSELQLFTLGAHGGAKPETGKWMQVTWIFASPASPSVYSYCTGAAMKHIQDTTLWRRMPVQVYRTADNPQEGVFGLECYRLKFGALCPRTHGWGVRRKTVAVSAICRFGVLPRAAADHGFAWMPAGLGMGGGGTDVSADW